LNKTKRLHISTNSLSPNIFVLAFDGKIQRRILDLTIAMAVAIWLLSQVKYLSMHSMLAGLVLGWGCTAAWMFNFSLIEMTIHSASNADFSAAMRHIRSSKGLVQLDEFHFSDIRSSRYFSHWKFADLKISNVNGAMRFEGPLLLLRQLVAELQRDGMEFEEDPNSPYKMIITGT